MKKLLVVALALFTLNGMAQERNEKRENRSERHEKFKDMTPTEIADLKSKRLTLDLDLTDAQQKKVHKLLLEQAETHKQKRDAYKAKQGEEKTKPSKEDFIKMKNQRLDEQIAMKREMKSILTDEQYAKFEKMNSRHHDKKGKHKKRSK